MRISFRELEIARTNPTAFAEIQAQSAATSGPRKRGYFQYWLDAVLRWHKEKADATVIRNQLEAKLTDKFKSFEKIYDTLERFDIYVEQYNEYKLVNQAVRVKSALPLPDDLSEDFEVSGKVSRLDRTPEFTYVACIIEKEAIDWISQLRMPLIQYSLADSLNLDLDQLSVAYYCFAEGSYLVKMYTESEIEAARNELVDLLDAMGSSI